MDALSHIFGGILSAIGLTENDPKNPKPVSTGSMLVPKAGLAVTPTQAPALPEQKSTSQAAKPASTSPVATAKPVTPVKPKKKTLDCYFEERITGMWWYGVEDKYGDKDHPYDHYGTFPTFSDAYQHMLAHFTVKEVAALDFDIFPQSDSPDDSWKPVQGLINAKKGKK